MNIYHVRILETEYENLLVKYPSLDVWSEEKVNSNNDGLIDITMYTTEAIAQDFQQHGSKHENLLMKESVNMDKLIFEEKVFAADCRKSTEGFLSKVTSKSILKENDFFKCFRPYVEIDAFVQKIQQIHSKYLNRFEISNTINGEKIYGYKLSLGGNKKRHAIYVQALLHAREWLAPTTAVYALASLLDAIVTNDLTNLKLLESFDWIFVPVVNIDGYKYTWTSSRLWRKNRREVSSWIGKQYGVDLNRNYGPKEKFGGKGASSNPGSQTYHGETPFSEPEIKGINDWMKTQGDYIAGGIDIHTYGKYILRPYGFDRTELPSPHEEKMYNLGKAVGNAIYSKHNLRFSNIAAHELYPASGTFMDSMFDSYDKRPSITFELRGNNFVVNPSEILKSGEEIFEGLRAFSKGVEEY